MKTHVEPFLWAQGWEGKKSLFKRVRNGQYQTIEFQFNKWGGSFAVRLSIVEPMENFDSANSKSIRSIRSQRLGSRNKRISKMRKKKMKRRKNASDRKNGSSQADYDK